MPAPLQRTRNPGNFTFAVACDFVVVRPAVEKTVPHVFVTRPRFQVRFVRTGSAFSWTAGPHFPVNISKTIRFVAKKTKKQNRSNHNNTSDVPTVGFEPTTHEQISVKIFSSFSGHTAGASPGVVTNVFTVLTFDVS